MNYQLINADVIEGLRHLPDASVHCVVTSPPYWGLRDYGTPPQIWGGDPACDHEWGDAIRTPWANDLPGPNGRKLNVKASRRRPKETGPFCQKCDAWRGSLGLEPEPELFVRNLVLVFREVRRVLRPEGVCFVNLGDSYYGSWQNYGGGRRGAGKQRPIIKGSQAQNPVWEGREGYRPAGTHPHAILKPKDLVGVPWRVALALQADGWWLRSDIIWSKPDQLPESVTDRPTKSHEYVFLLTKSARYFYDNEAIKEPAVSDHPSGNGFKRENRLSYQNADGTPRGSDQQWTDVGGTRNRRTVWTISTRANSENHYATFPQALPEICIKAGSSEKGSCPKCGAPWARVVKRRSVKRNELPKSHPHYRPGFYTDGKAGDPQAPGPGQALCAVQTLGWKPTCKCEDAGDPVDCVVLDPFAGTSTTGVVAVRLGRRFVGIELNPEYVEMSYCRLGAAERQAYGDLFLPLVKEAEEAPLFRGLEEQ